MKHNQKYNTSIPQTPRRAAVFQETISLHSLVQHELRFYRSDPNRHEDPERRVPNKVNHVVHLRSKAGKTMMRYAIGGLGQLRAENSVALIVSKHTH